MWIAVEKQCALPVKYFVPDTTEQFDICWFRSGMMAEQNSALNFVDVFALITVSIYWLGPTILARFKHNNLRFLAGLFLYSSHFI